MGNELIISKSMDYKEMWFLLMDSVMRTRNAEDEYSSKRAIMQDILDEMMKIQISSATGDCSLGDECGLPFVEVG